MPIETLINAVKQWATRMFATRGEVDAAVDAVTRTFATHDDVDAAVEANAPDWNAAEGEPGYIANKPNLEDQPPEVGAVGNGEGSEVFNDYNNNVANGQFCHAEGYNTSATGSCTHAEGYLTEASMSHSHAEGNVTRAANTAAHAEGYSTKANGEYSHAEGEQTIAGSTDQHVQGKFNVEDTAGAYAHIVGNGTARTKRSNAHTLDWDGNAWYAGTVLVGGTSQADAAEVATKAYVDEMLGVIENGSY